MRAPSSLASEWRSSGSNMNSQPVSASTVSPPACTRTEPSTTQTHARSLT